MSGVGPTAPEQPTDETGNQVKSADPRPAVPPGYDSHVVPGPPGAYVPPPAGYPAGVPMGYYGPQQPGAFPFGQPPSGTHPVQYQPGRYPVSSQSAPVIWMPGPTPMPDCPPGLECLTQLDNIHVFQHFEPLELITRFEINNKYDVKNNLGQMVYFVTEDTDDFTRNAYRTLRPFVLRVTDSMGREIMTMQRPFRCTCCCFCCPSTRQEAVKRNDRPCNDQITDGQKGGAVSYKWANCFCLLEVQCPPGRTLGFVRDHWNMCQVAYSIQNEKREKVLSIRGPCSTCGCCSDSVFQVRGIDGASGAGSVVRKWHGLMSAMGQADHYDIHFPLDLDVRMKAMIFGACFLIDFMYYERSPQDRRTR